MRGFVVKSTFDLMKQPLISWRKRSRALKAMAEAPEKSSNWIWLKKNESEFQKA